MVAVEPLPKLYKQIPETNLIIKLNSAVADIDGLTEFSEGDSTEAGTIMVNKTDVGSIKVPTITLESLLNKYKIDHVTLMKVDIEGAETLLFNSVTDDVLDRIDQISVEFHDAYPEWSFLGVTTEWVNSLNARLESIGFKGTRIFPTNNLDNLYINTKKVEIPTVPKMYLFLKDIIPLIP